MERGLQYWKQELFRITKKLVRDTIVYTVRNVVASFIEEHFIKRPLKEIFKINKKWGFEDDYAF